MRAGCVHCRVSYPERPTSPFALVASTTNGSGPSSPSTAGPQQQNDAVYHGHHEFSTAQGSERGPMHSEVDISDLVPGGQQLSNADGIQQQLPQLQGFMMPDHFTTTPAAASSRNSNPGSLGAWATSGEVPGELLMRAAEHGSGSAAGALAGAGVPISAPAPPAPAPQPASAPVLPTAPVLPLTEQVAATLSQCLRGPAAHSISHSQDVLVLAGSPALPALTTTSAGAISPNPQPMRTGSIAILSERAPPGHTISRLRSQGLPPQHATRKSSDTLYVSAAPGAPRSVGYVRTSTAQQSRSSYVESDSSDDDGGMYPKAVPFNLPIDPRTGLPVEVVMKSNAAFVASNSASVAASIAPSQSMPAPLGTASMGVPAAALTAAASAPPAPSGPMSPTGPGAVSAEISRQPTIALGDSLAAALPAGVPIVGLPGIPPLSADAAAALAASLMQPGQVAGAAPAQPIVGAESILSGPSQTSTSPLTVAALYAQATNEAMSVLHKAGAHAGGMPPMDDDPNRRKRMAASRQQREMAKQVAATAAAQRLGSLGGAGAMGSSINTSTGPAGLPPRPPPVAMRGTNTSLGSVPLANAGSLNPLASIGGEGLSAHGGSVQGDSVYSRDASAHGSMRGGSVHGSMRGGSVHGVPTAPASTTHRTSVLAPGGVSAVAASAAAAPGITASPAAGTPGSMGARSPVRPGDGTVPGSVHPAASVPHTLSPMASTLHMDPAMAAYSSLAFGANMAAAEMPPEDGLLRRESTESHEEMSFGRGSMQPEEDQDEDAEAKLNALALFAGADEVGLGWRMIWRDGSISVHPWSCAVHASVVR